MAGNLTAMIASIFSGGVTPDPYFEYTTLLLPGNGTNLKNNNEFLDSSSNAFTVTRNPLTGPNAPTQGTFSPFSQTGWGNYFDGNGDYLTAPSNSAFDFSNSNFTIECWVYLTAYSINWSGSYNASIISRDANTGASSGRNYWLNINGTSSSWTGLSFGFFSGSTLSTKSESYAFSLNTWYNIAVVRSSGQVNFYVNGSVVGSGTTMSSAPNTNAIPVYIGQQGYSTAEYYFPGYISNLRLVNGVAVYTGNFTPSTSALTATQSAGTNINAITTGQTKLLTCQSNRFVDNGQGNTSNTPFTLTVYGNTSVQAFSPFNPTASWSAATYGGSGYFDGNGDYLTAASNAAFAFGTGVFTIEAWVYLTSTAGANIFQDETTNSYQFYVNTSSKLEFTVSGVAVIATSSASIVANQWNHVAVVREGTGSNQVKLYINGGQDGSGTSATSIVNSATNYIGRTGTGTRQLNGYLSDLRIVKGTAVYTGNFTPPTAPLTAITNTSLLLNFTNAGIYDATSKNDLETVGNAQISTTQSKWGGSSIYVDGTGDRLFNGISSPLLNLSSGDWTIESWVYFNAVGAYAYVLNIATAPANPSGLVFGINNSSRIYIGNGAVLGTNGNTTLSTGQWYYLAAVKSGSNVTLYVNGTADVTPFAFTPNSGTYLYVGADASAGNQLNAYLQDVRITRYARPITASPTAAFPTL
jgi:hypothetical protein